MITQLDAPTITGKPEVVVRVEIIADTIINRNGRGVPIFKGSVLDVTGTDALMLFASVKAKKSAADVKIVPNPYLNSPLKKV